MHACPSTRPRPGGRGPSADAHVPRRQPRRRRLRDPRGGDSLPRPGASSSAATRTWRSSTSACPTATASSSLRGVRAGDRRTARIDPDLPLLVLSGRSSELERLRGFDRGSDDYVVKPFTYPRAARADRRAAAPQPAPPAAAGGSGSGRWRSTRSSRQVWLDGAPLALRSKEFALLRALAAEPTRVFTREELLRDGLGLSGPRRDAHARLARLAAAPKLRARGAELVVNVWGVGYRLVDAGAV